MSKTNPVIELGQKKIALNYLHNKYPHLFGIVSVESGKNKCAEEIEVGGNRKGELEEEKREESVAVEREVEKEKKEEGLVSEERCVEEKVSSEKGVTTQTQSGIEPRPRAPPAPPTVG